MKDGRDGRDTVPLHTNRLGHGSRDRYIFQGEPVGALPGTVSGIGPSALKTPVMGGKDLLLLVREFRQGGWGGGGWSGNRGWGGSNRGGRR